MTCPACGRPDPYGWLGAYATAGHRTCVNCGRFEWTRAPRKIEIADPLLAAWRSMFFHIGFAIEIHGKWIARPWLTRPICVCHPQTFVPTT